MLYGSLASLWSLASLMMWLAWIDVCLAVFQQCWQVYLSLTFAINFASSTFSSFSFFLLICCFVFFHIKKESEDKYARIVNALQFPNILCQYHSIFFLFKTKSFWKKLTFYLSALFVFFISSWTSSCAICFILGRFLTGSSDKRFSSSIFSLFIIRFKANLNSKQCTTWWRILNRIWFINISNIINIIK